MKVIILLNKSHLPVLKPAVLNGRSLTNKSFVIGQLVEKHRLDFLFLAET